jgi:uncharacterized membrane protein required for colicin V production
MIYYLIKKTKTMIDAFITGFFCVISFYIGLYRGMKKGTKIAKKVYREFGFFLPDNLKDKL